MAAVSAVPEATKFGVHPAYELFEPRTVYNQTMNGHVESIYPETGLSENVSGPITYRLNGTSDYIDFNKTDLYISGSFKGQLPNPADGKLVDITDKTLGKNTPFFSWVNLLPHALFQAVEVAVNGTTITPSDPNYMYRAFFNAILNNNPATQHIYMALSGWFKDQGTYDGFDPKHNKSLEIRRQRANDDLECFFTIDLATPLMQLQTLLISECDVTITLRRNTNPAFYMMHDTTAGRVEFQIKEAILRVRKQTPWPEIISAHEKILAEKKPVTYILDDPRLIVTSIQAGETFIHREYATMGHHPKHILAAMVETEAYNGAADKNPFNFQHFDVAKLTLTKNGMEYPTNPLTMDFKKGNYVEAYRHFLASLQAVKSPFVPDVTLKDFANGVFIASWDMSPDQYGGDDPQMLVSRTSNIKLSIEFSKQLPKPITLLFYYQLESRLCINQSRQVTHETVS